MDIQQQVPVIDGTKITRREFKEQYLKRQKPVILRGLWKQYPAYEKWTLDFFEKELGDIEVNLISTKQSHPSETLSSPHKVMKFKDYLNLSRTEPTDLRLFLFPVFKHKPELLKDFGYPDIAKRYIKIPFLFYGPIGSITRMHFDIDMNNVFLTQFDGVRRVVLFAPDQSRLLYQVPYNVHSMVDIDHPDYEQYPGLKYVKGQTAILERGDTLFMPGGYWHHIEYLESGFGLSVRNVNSVKNLLLGVRNLVFQKKFDDFANRFWRDKWYAYKKGKAIKRAQQDIDKILKTK